jgi:predicted DNA-binding transcriptional regulator AlpA
MSDRLLRPAQASLKYDVSIPTLYRWARQGKFPKFKPIVEGGRATAVRESEADRATGFTSSDQGGE